MRHEANVIFDALGKASVRVIREDQIAQKKAQTANLKARRCGNCALWMTSGCLPEKRSGRIRSMNDAACNHLELTPNKYLLDIFERELAELEEQK